MQYFTDAAEIQKAHESVRHDDDGHGGTPPESEANEPLVDAMDSIASAQLSGDVVSNAAAVVIVHVVCLFCCGDKDNTVLR